MQISQFISASLVLIVMICKCESRTDLFCSDGGCGDKCDSCKWGSVYNEFCEYRECGKPPGHQCHEVQDTCGPGLQCRCGRCHGCSSVRISEECVSSNCVPRGYRSLPFQN